MFYPYSLMASTSSFRTTLMYEQTTLSKYIYVYIFMSIQKTLIQQPAVIKTHIYFKNPFRNLSLYNRTIKLGNIVPDNWFYQAENM